MSSRRVVVAMSGGVDSSVAAALLLREGYDVIGVTLRLKAPQVGFPTDDLSTSAQAVADHLGISLRILDRTDQFSEEVLRPSWEEYARGRTPNPCVMCNPVIKFHTLMDVAREADADWIASGHYARVARESEGHSCLLRARDRTKDQSYFLFALTPEHLARVKFPLGDLAKPEVRGIARELGLPSADRVESQDACVVGLGDTLPEFLRTTFDAPSCAGPIVSTEGSRLGTHDGFHRFTIGQRRGVGIAVGAPAWVKEIDPATGRITMTTDQKDLFASGLCAGGMLWRHTPPCAESFACQVQVRYGHKPALAVVRTGAHATAVISFETPVRAVTPGQAVVLYDDDRVIGGGWIDKAIRTT